mmetsp:Transcript_48669/g.115645  ORF Transcript_48669/g.115645 Transcript_48669/m.115645 type:complete len:443 (-) Transcript_48669:1844-3172(-)
MWTYSQREDLVPVVGENGAQPLLALSELHALSLSVGSHLVLADLVNREVLGFWVGKDQCRNTGSWQHGERVRQANACVLLGLDDIPHCLLLSVVWLRWVARCRSDTLVLDLQEVAEGQVLIWRISPVLGSDILVQQLCEGLHKAICQCLAQDLGVIIVLLLVHLHQLLCSEAGHSEHTHVVLLSTRGHIVRLGSLLTAIAEVGLLSEHAEAASHLCSAFVLEDFDIFAILTSVGCVQAHHTLQGHGLLLNDLCDHLLRIVVELLSLCAHLLILEDLGVALVRVPSTELPSLEEWVPIDEWNHIGDRVLVQHGCAHHLWLWWHWLGREVNDASLLACLLEAQVLALCDGAVVFLSHLLVLLQHVSDILGLLSTEEGAHNCHRPRRIQHVNHGMVDVGIDWRELHSSVSLAGGCASDQYWNVVASLLHLLADEDHLVKRWCDQA